MKKLNILISLLLITSTGFSQQISDGFAPLINDFSTPLKSGVYSGQDGCIGKVPDVTHIWNHLFVIRHTNPANNHQLQIASSFSENDRLFFRKFSSANLSSSNSAWIELATRGSNTFYGNQTIHGNLDILNYVNKIVGFSDPTNYYIGHFPVSGSAGLDIHYYGGIRFGDKTSDSVMQITNGNIGIGTSNPSSYEHGGNNKVLEINNSNTTVHSQSHIILSSGANLPNSYVGSLTWALPNTSSSFKGVGYLAMRTENGSTSSKPSVAMVFATRSASNDVWSEQMQISSLGNVGIGTSNPTNKLDVNGTIHSKEVKVDMIGWSDFVFKKEYNLPTLEEVEKHITEKGHLENIPNEEDVLKNGINLGEMNAKLLQKIEELTLYVIEIKKENSQIKKRLEKI